jgi:hypothetical protein
MIVAAVGRPPQISSKKLLARHRLSAEKPLRFHLTASNAKPFNCSVTGIIGTEGLFIY